MSEIRVDLLEIEEEKETIENVVPPQDIFAFNESRSCADLKRMYDKKQLDISPNFQREQVWKLPDRTRFLDSLLKNLPIPSMCISLDIKSQKRIVIDGLQRISTIVQFLDAVENNTETFQLSSLGDVDERLSGKTIRQIKNDSAEVIAAIENASIPVTVLRCDLDKRNHMEYIFTIFHRLNTGGIKLNNQEIRNCIFNGELNDFLFKCANDNKEKLESVLNSGASRFAYEEFILRFLSFQDQLDDYTGRLVSFLNDYMEKNKNPTNIFLEERKNLFQDALNLFCKLNISEKVSKVILEAALYGIAKNLEILKSENKKQLQTRYDRLLSSSEFQRNELQGGLLQQAKVNARLNRAKEIFS